MRAWLALGGLLLAPAAASAQGWPVHDALTAAKVEQLTRLTRQQLDVTKAALAVLQQLGAGLPRGVLGGITRRTGTTADEPHRAEAFLYGGPFLAALNGDQRYRSETVVDRALVPLAPFPDVARALTQIPPEAQEALRIRLANVDVADSILRQAVARRAAARQASQASEAAITKWEAELLRLDTTRGASASLDMLAGAELIRLRQAAVQQQLTASMLEQLLVQTKRARDADAEAANRWVTGALNWRERSAATTKGSAEALRRRQP